MHHEAGILGELAVPLLLLAVVYWVTLLALVSRISSWTHKTQEKLDATNRLLEKIAFQK